MFKYFDPKNKCLYFYKYYNGLYGIALNGQVLNSWHEGKTEHDISSDAIAYILQQSDSTLLVATQSNGFNVLNVRTGHVIQFLKYENDGSSHTGTGIQSVYIDKVSNIWLATTGALVN